MTMNAAWLSVWKFPARMPTVRIHQYDDDDEAEEEDSQNNAAIKNPCI